MMHFFYDFTCELQFHGSKKIAIIRRCPLERDINLPAICQKRRRTYLGVLLQCSHIEGRVRQKGMKFCVKLLLFLWVINTKPPKKGTSKPAGKHFEKTFYTQSSDCCKMFFLCETISLFHILKTWQFLGRAWQFTTWKQCDPFYKPFPIWFKT